MLAKRFRTYPKTASILLGRTEVTRGKEDHPRSPSSFSFLCKMPGQQQCQSSNVWGGVRVVIQARQGGRETWSWSCQRLPPDLPTAAWGSARPICLPIWAVNNLLQTSQVFPRQIPMSPSGPPGEAGRKQTFSPTQRTSKRQ